MSEAILAILLAVLLSVLVVVVTIFVLGTLDEADR